MTDEPTVPPDHGPEPLPPEARRALEAMVLVAADPVPPQLIAQLLEVGVDRVEAECEVLAAEYEADGRGFVLSRIAGGYRFQSHPDAAPYVERYLLEGQSARLSSAALETLAIVAYKQPLSRAQVASIRGVNVDGVMRTLTQRGLIEEVARDPGPGQAVLYGTTPLFLERLGLDALDDLPPIADFVPGADVVEALEQGLRVDDGPDGDGDADDAEGPEGADDGSGLDHAADEGTPDGAVDLTDLGQVQGWEADLDGDDGDR